jgi:hypothetical protein
MCGFGKKETGFKKTNRSDQNSEPRLKTSRVASNIDMISMSNAPPIEKAAFGTPRVKTYSPGTMNLDKISPGGSKSIPSNEASNNDTDRSEESERTLHDGLKKTYSPRTMDSGIASPGGGKPTKVTAEGVRTYQVSFNDSIRSKSFKEIGQVFPHARADNIPVGSAGKVGIVGQNNTNGGTPLSKANSTRNTAATKLYSKAIGSLSSNINHRNGIEERKVASLGRTKNTSNLLGKK